MAAHKVCYRLVPSGPISADRRDVPPVSVELSVTKTHYLCEGVEGGLEEGEKATEPAEDADGRKFHDAFGDGCEVQGEDFVK